MQCQALTQKKDPVTKDFLQCKMDASYGSDLCGNHKKMEEAGKTLVRVNAPTVESPLPDDHEARTVFPMAWLCPYCGISIQGAMESQFEKAVAEHEAGHKRPQVTPPTTIEPVKVAPVQAPVEKKEAAVVDNNRKLFGLTIQTLIRYFATMEFVTVVGTGSRRLQTASVEEKIRVFNILLEELAILKDLFGNKLWICSGMAEGFDKALAKASLQVGVNLALAIPNKGYIDYYWSGRGSLDHQDHRAEANEIIAAASLVRYVKEDVYGITAGGVYLDVVNKTASWQPGPGLVHANLIRNEYMVDKGDLFYVYNKVSTGTKHAYGLIRNKRLTVGGETIPAPYVELG